MIGLVLFVSECSAPNLVHLKRARNQEIKMTSMFCKAKHMLTFKNSV